MRVIRLSPRLSLKKRPAVVFVCPQAVCGFVNHASNILDKRCVLEGYTENHGETFSMSQYLVEIPAVQRLHQSSVLCNMTSLKAHIPPSLVAQNTIPYGNIFVTFLIFNISFVELSWHLTKTPCLFYSNSSLTSTLTVLILYSPVNVHPVNVHLHLVCFRVCSHTRLKVLYVVPLKTFMYGHYTSAKVESEEVSL